jgi:hypothetical protein
MTDSPLTPLPLTSQARKEASATPAGDAFAEPIEADEFADITFIDIDTPLRQACRFFFFAVLADTARGVRRRNNTCH